jgi:hypothetical protein
LTGIDADITIFDLSGIMDNEDDVKGECLKTADMGSDSEIEMIDV